MKIDWALVVSTSSFKIIITGRRVFINDFNLVLVVDR